MISFPNDNFTWFTFNYFIVTIQVYFTFLLTFKECCSGLCSYQLMALATSAPSKLISAVILHVHLSVQFSGWQFAL